MNNNLDDFSHRGYPNFRSMTGQTPDLDLRRSDKFQNMLENANINATMQTMVGPVGVSS